jgi:hypothetical protein
MRFIGELYKCDLISIKIMTACLPQLLFAEKEGYDEEKVECFAKLMTVIGSSLEKQSGAMKSVGKGDVSESLEGCWRTVEGIAGMNDGKNEEGAVVSNRIKFMLQDLLEMKRNGEFFFLAIPHLFWKWEEHQTSTVDHSNKLQVGSNDDKKNPPKPYPKSITRRPKKNAPVEAPPPTPFAPSPRGIYVVASARATYAYWTNKNPPWMMMGLFPW